MKIRVLGSAAGGGFPNGIATVRIVLVGVMAQ